MNNKLLMAPTSYKCILKLMTVRREFVISISCAISSVVNNSTEFAHLKRALLAMGELQRLEPLARSMIVIAIDDPRRFLQRNVVETSERCTTDVANLVVGHEELFLPPENS
jgi:hypothetical protein